MLGRRLDCDYSILLDILRSSIIKKTTRKLLLVLFTMLLPLTGLADEVDTDGCVYSQEAFPQMLEQLRKLYPQAKYTSNKDAVDIPLEDGTVRVSYGGCEHYGTNIRYIAKWKTGYSTAEAFDKTAELVQQFGQNRVDQKVLRKIFSQRKFEKAGGMFNLAYPDMSEFTIELGQKAGRVTLEINFYN